MSQNANTELGTAYTVKMDNLDSKYRIGNLNEKMKEVFSKF